MAPAVTDGLLSAIPDSRNGAGVSTSSRPEGQSESTANRAGDEFDPAAPRNNAGCRLGLSKRKQRATIRFYPYQDANRPSLPFSSVARTLPSENSIIRVGRYSERDGAPIGNQTEPSDAPVGFKSKVVSRKHCEFSFVNGQWHVKDVGSSSGTFLNHMRLSQPNVKSRLYAVRDGDIVQLGIDFKGGEEMIFRCVRIRIECNRSWQQLPNEFNKNTESLIKNLGKGDAVDYEGCRECSICLGSVLRPYQCLFMAACAHVWHYKCIHRWIHTPDYPMFQCPNCRAYTDLSAEVDDSNDFEDEERNDEARERCRDERSATPRVEPTATEPIREPNGEQDAALATAVQQLTLEETNPFQSESETVDPTLAGSFSVIDRSAEIPIPAPTPAVNIQSADRPSANLNAPLQPETFEDNPMTPRNESGPLAFDGHAGRL